MSLSALASYMISLVREVDGSMLVLSLSDNVNDVLGLSITNLDLEDLSKMLNLEVDLAGKVNGSVGLANPYEALTLTSNVDILSFFINQDFMKIPFWHSRVSIIFFCPFIY